ncbi:MAG: RidA family protein [Proteocatella sp.]
MKSIVTSKAPAAIGPYSQGKDTGNIVFTSGQLPINMETGQMETEIKAATKASLDNVKSILEEAGLTMADVVKTTVFISDMENFGEMNEVYAGFFGENAPARSCVQVARLPKDALVEIEAIAIRG